MIKRGVRSAECGTSFAGTLVALLVALLLCTATFAAAEDAPADAVGLIENHYRGLVDLTAAVVQKNYLRTLDRTQTFKGTLSIKRPGKLRLEYTNGQVIVIDGSEAWFYSKKSEQAIRRTFRDFEQANIPVAFLLGAAAIGQEFDVSVPDPRRPRVLDLVPKKKTGAAMQKLRLVADEDGRIAQLTVYDRSGNTSEATFSNIREGVGVDDDLFRFKVPKGTEIIEQ
jgi:outer membrane lipoprotein carrier protein